MRFSPKYPRLGTCLAWLSGVFTAAFLMGPQAVQAFTIENKDQDGTAAYAVPKFDLEEQARNFRAGEADKSQGVKRDFDTPLGKGTMQFGVQQGSSPAFGFGPGSLGPMMGSRAGRADFNRMVTPENLR
jgi:hypothetical protein